jgi:hypothetical protein
MRLDCSLCILYLENLLQAYLMKDATPKMKPGEQMAYDYFLSRGVTDIRYEPVPNRTPDFVLDKRIAVEVTRLSQFVPGSAGIEPLEDLEYALIPRFKRLLKSIPRGAAKGCCFASLHYARPIVVDKLLMADIKSFLIKHLECMTEEKTYHVRENTFLIVRPTKPRFFNPFTLGSHGDDDGGGLVLQNIFDSLRIVIPRKEKKILQYKSEYSTWWLAVNDRIGWGLDEADLRQLEEAFNIPTFFEKIVLISPFDATQGVELDVRVNITR